MTHEAEPIRVVLVDDHEHVLWGLNKLIGGEWPRMIVAGTARTVAQLLAGVRECRPDVVVLDVCLGSDNSLDHLAQIRECGAAVLVLTGSHDPRVHRRALENGACTVVLKEEPAAILLREIEHAHQARQASGRGMNFQQHGETS